MTAKEFEEYLKKEVKTIQKLAKEICPNKVNNKDADNFLTIMIGLRNDYYDCWTLDHTINFDSFTDKEDE